MSVTGDGGAVIAHAGSIGLRMLAENTGLTGALSTAMARRSFIPSVRDRGQVLTDVAVLLADGGEAISDIDVLRHQRQILGPVASAPTVWRALDEVTDARRRKIATARARVRRHVWSQLTATGGVLASKVAGTDLGETIVLDVDATIVVTHSEKKFIGCCMSRPDSSMALAGDGCVYPRPGPGSSNSWPRSPGSPRSHHLPDPTSPSLPEETWRTAHRQRQPANNHALTWPRVQIGPRQPGWQLSSRLMKDGG